MKFYRVRYTHSGGNSLGFSWHTTKSDAERAQADAVRQDPGEYEASEPLIEEIEIGTRKADLLRALNEYAKCRPDGYED